MRYLAALLMLVLGACSGPRVMAGGPWNATVRANGPDVAVELASEHCGRYGRVPQFIGSEPDRTGQVYYRYLCE